LESRLCKIDIFENAFELSETVRVSIFTIIPTYVKWIPTHTHSYRCIRDVAGVYIIYITHLHTCMYYLYEKETERKKIAGLNNTPTPLPLLCRCAYVNVSRLCSRCLPAAAEDHIAGTLCGSHGGVRCRDECATKPVDRIGRTRQFTYWPGPRRAVAHKIRAHLSQAFTAAASVASVWLPAIRMGIYRYKPLGR